MSQDKKVRVMTAKGFLHRSSTAKSAIAFLSAHRDFLTTGELAQFTSPIVARIDEGSLMPTPGLSEVRNVVLAHMLAKETLRGEAALLRASEPSKSNKAYVATIYHANGEIITRKNEDINSENYGQEKELIQGFELGQRANEWADRRLFEQESDAYAEVIAVKLVTEHGPMVSIIKRDEAIERLFPRKVGPVMHKKPMSTSKLGFGVKAGNDIAKFSRG
jgi:hypothetical protein